MSRATGPASQRHVSTQKRQEWPELAAYAVASWGWPPALTAAAGMLSRATWSSACRVAGSTPPATRSRGACCSTRPGSRSTRTATSSGAASARSGLSPRPLRPRVVGALRVRDRSRGALPHRRRRPARPHPPRRAGRLAPSTCARPLEKRPEETGAWARWCRLHVPRDRPRFFARRGWRKVDGERAWLF